MAVAVEAQRGRHVTNLPKTVTVDTETLIEAIASMDALSAYFATMAGGQDTPIGNFPMKIAWELAEAAFDRGVLSPLDDPADPLTVAIEARSDELAAELLDDPAERRERYAARARRIRETGTTSHPFRPAES